MRRDFLQEVEHGGFDRDVEAGRRLVEHQEVRSPKQRAGNHHPLLLAAAQLMRVALHQLGSVR